MLQQKVTLLITIQCLKFVSLLIQILCALFTRNPWWISSMVMVQKMQQPAKLFGGAPVRSQVACQAHIY